MPKLAVPFALSFSPNAGEADAESMRWVARHELLDCPDRFDRLDHGAMHNILTVLRHGAKLLYAYCSATVPRIQLILRKAYGGAYIVMDSRSVGADLAYARPINEIAVMGAQAAANVIFRRDIAAATDPETLRAKWIAEYRRELMHPYHAAERGLIDDIIDTRRTLIESLRLLGSKHADLPIRKHGNPPHDDNATNRLPGNRVQLRDHQRLPGARGTGRADRRPDPARCSSSTASAVKVRTPRKPARTLGRRASLERDAPALGATQRRRRVKFG